MKRVLIGAIACLALVSIEADDCSGAAFGTSTERAPLTVTVSSNTSTGQASSKMIKTYSIRGTDPVDEVAVRQLASGDNSFTVPTVPSRLVGCILVPPADNGASLTLKGSPGDTGLRISKKSPTLIVFDTEAVPGKIIIHSSAPFAVGQVLTITWF
jgi:hypothetical protein